MDVLEKEFVLNNEENAGNYILFITDKDQFVSKSISILNIQKILKKYNIDPTIFKKNRRSVSESVAESIFKEYLAEIEQIVNDCYGVQKK